jgi:hypothetical protein
MQNITADHPVEDQVRKVYYVLGKSSLPYAERCIASLVRSSTETMAVVILTDSPADAASVSEAITPLFAETRHSLRVIDEVEARARADTYYADFPAIRQFREGHPCWRKITDPQMYAAFGEEVIILDPDVYFPNQFAFEPAPEFGVALMYQPPNCLLPEDVVRRAFEEHITMADHTDIGVCQFNSPINFFYLEEILTKLSEKPLPRSMHIESIVWAALAAQWGGGHFLPQVWHCYRNSLSERVARRLGRSGIESLKRLKLKDMKAFHAGGEAKYWLVDAEKAGILAHRHANVTPTPKVRYKPFSRSKFERKFLLRRIAAKTGLSRLWQ